jgi:small ubiquitin-related modifier
VPQIKPTTRLERVFNVYASRRGVDVAMLRFLLDGQRLVGSCMASCPGLEEGDQIHAFLEQMGD